MQSLAVSGSSAASACNCQRSYEGASQKTVLFKFEGVCIYMFQEGYLILKFETWSTERRANIT